MKKNLKFSKEQYILICIFLFGFAVRLLFVGQFPAGLNQDEASSGYEAFSVMNYGIDRNGVENPIHLISWGSGQNMAYSWLAMPFLKLFGNTTMALRLPMAIVGCISLYMFWLLFKELFDSKLSVWAALFFAMYPWHIMKSRWALESNIFPDLVLWGCVLILTYIRTQKPVLLFSSVLVFSFSLYSYGTAYMFMPFFIGGVWIYMAVKGKITIKNFVFSALLFFVTALPIILFVLINITDLPQIHILGFTVPKMYVSRFSTVTGTGDNFIAGCISNMKDFITIMLNQGDGLSWNSMDFFGICYKPFLPFIVIGILLSIFQRNEHSFIIHWWLICALAVVSVSEVNVNRANIIFIPLAYYIVVSIGFISKHHKVISVFFASLVLCLFLMFSKNYFTDYNENVSKSFFYSYEDALTLAENYETEKIYIHTHINQPYIHTLFFTKANPHTYMESRVVSNPYGAFEKIQSFDKYIFSLPEVISADEDAAYIIRNDYTDLFDKNLFEVTVFKYYSVAVPKN